MKFFFGRPLFGVMLILFVGSVQASGFSSRMLLDKPVNEQRIDSLLNAMSLKLKVSQLFVTYPYVKNGEPFRAGGILMLGNFSSDSKSVKAKIAKIKRLSPIPPFVVSDIEGGLINRLRKDRWLRYLPSPRSMAKLSDRQVGRWGYQTGKVMKKLGLNMNFAPVLDISSRGLMKDSRRSFSGNKEVVKAKAKAFSAGLLRAGIVPVGKHFPGYGNIEKNTDFELVHATKGEVNFNETLEVFHAVSPWLGGLMVSHEIFSEYGEMPASLNPKIIEMAKTDDLLIITDDLAIRPLNRFFKGGRREVIKNAFLAGSDMFLLTTPMKWKGVDYAETIYNMVKKQPRLEAEVNRRVRKILRLKFQMGLFR